MHERGCGGFGLRGLGFGLSGLSFRLRDLGAESGHSALAAGPILDQKHDLVTFFMGDAVAVVLVRNCLPFISTESYTDDPSFDGAFGSHGLTWGVRRDQEISDRYFPTFKVHVHRNATGKSNRPYPGSKRY